MRDIDHTLANELPLGERDALSRGKLPQLCRALFGVKRDAIPGAAATGAAGRAAPITGIGLLRSEATLLGGLRILAMSMLLAGIAVSNFQSAVVLPVPQLLAAALSLGILAAWILVRARRRNELGAPEFCGQLLLDVAVGAYVLYWTGGAAVNPCADLYLLLVCVAAITLPWRQLGVIVASVVAAYSILIWQFEPLVIDETAVNLANLNALAHWTRFIVTALLVAALGYRLTAASRRDSSALARMQEQQAARSESAVSLATLAAGTAHEMNTPLTTLAVVVSDLRREASLSAEHRRDLDAAWNAIQACSQSLAEVVAAVGADRIVEEHLPIDRVLACTLERMQSVRPGVPVMVSRKGAGPAPQVKGGPSLRQALLSLLNNAADACPGGIEVHLHWGPSDVCVDILDRGRGVPREIKTKLGATIVSTKDERCGTGVGVFLANKAVARLGGSLVIRSRPGGGTCARVRLPILAASASNHDIAA